MNHKGTEDTEEKHTAQKKRTTQECRRSSSCKARPTRRCCCTPAASRAVVHSSNHVATAVAEGDLTQKMALEIDGCEM